MTKAGRHIFFGLAYFVAATSAAPAERHDSNFALCTIGKTKMVEHCGVVEVFENRATRTGRKIPVHVIEIDAAHRSHRAIFWNAGGPGGGDADDVPAIVGGLFEKELLTLHDTYDLVFVDNRGTGSSHPLNCDLTPRRYPERYYAQLYPSGPLRACRATLAKTTDLSQYTTDITVDDIDDVRAAMYYPKIVLDGGSYGTMLYLDYVRRHPTNVESVVLQGVAPPGELLIPLEDAQGARTAMRDLIFDCGHDAVCHKTYPSFGTHFAALVHRFDTGPVTMTVTNAITKRPQRVQLSKEVSRAQQRADYHVLGRIGSGNAAAIRACRLALSPERAAIRDSACDARFGVGMHGCANRRVRSREFGEGTRRVEMR